MMRKEKKGYYALILSTGYGVFDDWSKIENLKNKFHKKGSNFFLPKKFDTFYEAAEYSLQTARERCAEEHIFVPYLLIPSVPNQLYFFSHLGYLKPEEMMYLYKKFNGKECAVEKEDVPGCYSINLVEFDRE